MRTWLITGVSSGFGQSLVDEVIRAGDFPVGTLRKAHEVDAFNDRYRGKALAVRLDVTDFAAIPAVVDGVARDRGGLDVLVNNAGYGMLGAIEELSLEEIRAQMETNFFGALAVTQAALPHLRQRGKGHVIQISSIAGFRAGPGTGAYNASKFALEGVSEALAHEVGPLGIHVVIVEPGPFRTKFASGSVKRAAREIAAYAPTAGARVRWIHEGDGKQPGDPVKAARLIVAVTRSERPPLRLVLGRFAIDGIRQKLDSVRADVEAWEKPGLATDF